MNKIDVFKGLYAITDTNLSSPNKLGFQVQQALDGGIRLLQYRDKQLSHDQRQTEVELLLGLCEGYDVPLVINDDVALAQTSGAQGVHLGREDGEFAQARQKLGSEAIIGVTCYNDFANALEAEEQGADYVAFGRFFPSKTKPQVATASTQLLMQAKQTLSIPTVAIGGITQENAAALVVAGADMLAVINGIFDQADIQATVRKFLPLFP